MDMQNKSKYIGNFAKKGGSLFKKKFSHVEIY